MCNVNIATGEVTQFEFDLLLSGRIPLRLKRSYSSAKPQPGLLGYGWSMNLGTWLRPVGNGLELTVDGSVAATVPLPGVTQTVHDDASGFTIARTHSTLQLTDREHSRFEFPSGETLPPRVPCSARYDYFGNSLQYEYDERRRLRVLVDSFGRRLLFKYDPLDRLLEITTPRKDAPNRVWTLVRYEYDDLEDLVAVYDAEGNAKRYEYASHLLTRVTDQVGRELYYQYDRQQRCVRTWFTGGVWDRQLQFDHDRKRVLVTDPLGHSTLYRHNGQGIVVAQTDALGRYREDILDDEGRVLMRTGSGANQEVLTYDPQEQSYTLTENGTPTRFKVNEQRRVTEMTDMDGNRWKWMYDEAGNETRSETPHGAVWSLRYNERGDLVRAVDPVGYERMRERTAERMLLHDSFGTLADVTYDELGRAISVRDGLGTRVDTEVNRCGHPIRFLYPGGVEARIILDPRGNPSELIDEIGRTVKLELNPAGTRFAFIRPDHREEVFEFGLKEELQRIVNAKGEDSTLEYDALGRCTAMRHFDGRVQRIEYNEHNFVVRLVDGLTGRLIGECLYSEGLLVEETYEDASQLLINYGPFGEILSAENADAVLVYEWDPLVMQLSSEQAGGLKLSFQRDLRGNRTKLSTNLGREIRYEWDGRRRLTKMVDSDQWAYEYTHNVLGLVTRFRMPNGLEQHFEYDVMHRMISRRVVRPDGTEVVARKFTYDAVGRLIEFDDTLRGRRRFAYSPIDSLLSVSDDQRIREEYDYDLNGNLLRTRLGEAIAYARGDRAIAAGNDAYEYDSRGMLTRHNASHGDTRYEYNGEGRLRRVCFPDGADARYEYDPLTRRISKTVNNQRTDFYWDGVHLLAERTGKEQTDYLFLPGSFFVAGMTRDGRHYSFVCDQLGTPTEVLDDTGRIVWAADYSAYGEITQMLVDEIVQPFRFLGQYFDDELGLHYNRFRYYDPRLGRFTCTDPIGLAGGLNLYNYAPNPINWADPLGLAHLSGGGGAPCCEVLSKCKWGPQTMKEAEKKVEGMKQAGGCTPDLDDPCAREDGHKELYVECKSKGDAQKKAAVEKKLASQEDSCKSIQVDHIKEVQCGGENVCDNLQELNQSVNASFGSQIRSCLSKLRDIQPPLSGVVSMSIKLVSDQAAHGKKPCDPNQKPACP